MKQLYPVLALSALLAACAGSPIAMERLSDDELLVSHPHANCNAYHYGKSERIRKVLVKQHVVREQNWAAIDAGKIRIGFNETELICARGEPRKINESGSRRSITRQWVYDDGLGRSYVYTDGNEVTGWN